MINIYSPSAASGIRYFYIRKFQISNLEIVKISKFKARALRFEKKPKKKKPLRNIVIH